jgi:predicted patatin/cPLA2 family phospholipase
MNTEIKQESCMPDNERLPDGIRITAGAGLAERGRSGRSPAVYFAFLGAVLLLLAGCSSMPERDPVPPELTTEVGIAGVPGARFWGDDWPKHAAEQFHALTEEDLRRDFAGIYRKPHNYLAISGGGANGAFGAGLLKGMDEAGLRPEFTMVTGVSTGALTAPFVFLGSDYDDQLEAVYTTTSTKDIAKKRGLIDAAFGDSVADTAPLKELMVKYFTAEMIAQIAREYERGRRLYIGTVNLDAGRSVIWNIGAIATSDLPNKVDLIHDILRASAAIPVAFPPIVITVESADGRSYDEMHVDGGTGSQVFVYPASVNWSRVTEKLEVEGKPNVYVIRNSFLDPDYQGMKRSVVPIASRTIDSLIRTQGVGDLYQIFALCKRDGNDFNLAYIPSEFIEKPTESFDPMYMRKLYDYGYELGRSGYDWKKAPPGFIIEH